MQEREQYVEKIKVELAEFDATFAALRNRVNHQPVDVQQEVAGAVAEIISQRDVIDREIEQLENTSLERWDQIKTGFEVSWRDIRDCADRIRAGLDEKSGTRISS